MSYMEGVLVSEEETAIGLGFANVNEFRRWQTDMGKKVWELEEKVRKIESDRDNFRWHGMRQQAVLEKIALWLEGFDSQDAKDAILAIKIVCNTIPDWHRHLDKWLKNDTKTN